MLVAVRAAAAREVCLPIHPINQFIAFWAGKCNTFRTDGRSGVRSVLFHRLPFWVIHGEGEGERTTYHVDLFGGIFLEESLMKLQVLIAPGRKNVRPNRANDFHPQELAFLRLNLGIILDQGENIIDDR